MKDPAQLFRLDGRVAVVTGASSGMGVVFAETLALAGAKVVLAARRANRLEGVAGRIRDAGGAAIAVRCDVARETQSLADWRAHVDVMLTGSFLCAQRFGRDMLAAGKGNIINVASMLGVVGSGQVRQAAYAAAKGGQVNLTRELAAQWARRGVRVNALAPGWFPTEMTGDMFQDERSMKWLRNRTPMGRGGELSELAGPLLFLASDASSFVTGQVLVVDGGWTIV